MSQDQSFLLGWHFVLFSSEFSHQLLAHGLKNRLEESSSKNQGCVIMCQGIAKSWNMTVAKPSGIVNFVGFQLLGSHGLFPCIGCLQFPMVQTMQKHFGQVIHGLPILGRQVVEFIQNKVGDTLCNTWFLKWRCTKRTFNLRLGYLQNTPSQ